LVQVLALLYVECLFYYDKNRPSLRGWGVERGEREQEEKWKQGRPVQIGKRKLKQN
jgi:hypothetical protein